MKVEKVEIYVEGPSDKLAMEALLRPLIDVKLQQGIKIEFIPTKGKNSDHRFQERFKVFCFKHDLESLILAAESQLSSRIDVTQPELPKTWTIPVENQNHDIPPKRIVEEIFKKYGKSYKESVDAPIILANARYQEIAELCPQAFKPFVQFLENL